MPGNALYNELLEVLMPSWDTNDIDIEHRTIGILGLPRSGKTTLAMTIVNDLKKRYPDLIVGYGYWLHVIVERILEQDKRTRHVLIIIEDATAHHPGAKKLLEKDNKVYWRIAHVLRPILDQYTAKISIIVNMHSYMMIGKYIRNVQALVIKSMLPRWQRWEHEDVTLPWFDNMIIKEMTRLRLSNPEAVLGKALAVFLDGRSGVIKYDAVKRWPKDTIIATEENEEEEAGEELEDIARLQRENKLLKEALRRIIEERILEYKIDKKKYINVKKNGKWRSLGPIAELVTSSKHTRQ